MGVTASSDDGGEMPDDLELIKRGMQMLGEDVTTSEDSRGAKILALGGGRRRRVVSAAVGSAAAITVGIFAVSSLDGGMESTGRGASSADPAASMTWAGFVSCQEAVVEGKIIKIDDSPSAKDTYILTLDVSRWLKPSTGPQTTEIEVKSRPGGHSFRLNKRVLIAAPKANEDGSRPVSDQWYSATQIKKFGDQIEQNLLESQSIRCPSNWKTIS